jgi:hypothetical protein
MQKYLSPAKRYMSRVVPHPADFRQFVHRHRLLVYGTAVTFLLVMMLGFAVIKGNMNTNSDAFTHEVHANGNSVTTTVTNGPIPISGNTNTSSPDGKTSVTVNNQSIQVPRNGSVSKTITNDDGSTTHVNVSHNSSNSGDSTSSSVSSSTNISTHTYSNNVNFNSP